MHMIRRHHLRRAASGEERLWIIWWGWGLAMQVFYIGLYILQDQVRYVAPAGADILDVLKLGVFAFWVVMAWRCSTNVDLSAWTVTARAALVVLVGLTAVTL